MPLTSPLKDVEIPHTDVLTYLFPPGSKPSEDPIWLDAADPENSLSPRQLLSWVKRLAIGLDRLGIRDQEAVMILTPNHIFVPAAYLGIVGSRRIFSAGNPIYTVSGKSSLNMFSNSVLLSLIANFYSQNCLINFKTQAPELCWYILLSSQQLSGRRRNAVYPQAAFSNSQIDHVHLLEEF
jgi:acyl-CoA synthetase (AMP-forming)/AMP-acid ligase II